MDEAATQQLTQPLLGENDEVGCLLIEGCWEHPVRRGVTMIGRDRAKCDIVVDDETVSKVHAIIRIKKPTEFYLIDLHSTNGTRCRSTALPPQVPTRFHYDDKLEFGSVFALLRRPPGAGAACPAAAPDDLPATQVVDTPPRPPRPAPALTVPESPDRSDKEDSFTVPVSGPHRKSSTCSRNIETQPTCNGSIFWKAPSRSPSLKFDLDESASSVTDSCDNGRIEKRLETTSVFINEMETQISEAESSATIHIPISKEINNIETQIPIEIHNIERPIPPEIHNMETQMPTEVYNIETQIPIELEKIHNMETQIPDCVNNEKHIFDYKNIPKNLHDAETQPISTEQINNKLINVLGPLGTTNTEEVHVTESDEEIICEEFDTQDFEVPNSQPLCDSDENDNFHKSPVISQNVTSVTNGIESDMRRDQNLGIKIEQKNYKLINDDDSTDCDDDEVKKTIKNDLTNHAITTMNITDTHSNFNIMERLSELEENKSFESDLLNVYDMATQIIHESNDRSEALPQNLHRSTIIETHVRVNITNDFRTTPLKKSSESNSTTNKELTLDKIQDIRTPKENEIYHDDILTQPITDKTYEPTYYNEDIPTQKLFSENEDLNGDKTLKRNDVVSIQPISTEETFVPASNERSSKIDIQNNSITNKGLILGNISNIGTSKENVIFNDILTETIMDKKCGSTHVNEDIHTQKLISENENLNGNPTFVPRDDMATPPILFEETFVNLPNDDISSKLVREHNQISQATFKSQTPDQTVKDDNDQISPFKIPARVSKERVKNKPQKCHNSKSPKKCNLIKSSTIDQADSNYYNETQDILNDLLTQKESGSANHYKCTQDIYKDLQSQDHEIVQSSQENVIVGERFKGLSTKMSPANNSSNYSSETEEHNVSTFDSLSSQQIRDVIGAEKNMEMFEMENTPKKEFDFDDLPLSEEISQRRNYSRIVNASLLSSSSSEEDKLANENSDSDTPIVSRKKKRVNKAKVDLVTRLDAKSLPTRMSARNRKPTEKGKGLINKHSFDDNVEVDIVQENIAKLKRRKGAKSGGEAVASASNNLGRSASRRSKEVIPQLEDEKTSVKKKHNLRGKISGSDTTADDVLKNNSLKRISKSGKEYSEDTKPSNKSILSKSECSKSGIETDKQNTSNKTFKETCKNETKETICKIALRKMQSKRKLSSEDGDSATENVKKKKSGKSSLKNVCQTNSLECSSPTISSLRRSHRQKKSMESDGDSPSARKQTSSGRPIPRGESRTRGRGRSRPDETEPAVALKVLYTAYDDVDNRNLLAKLGAQTVDEVDACSVLVTRGVKRTIKLLSALSAGRPVVGDDWVRACRAAGRLVDPWAHLLRDAAAERRFGFSVPAALAAPRGFLRGYRVAATPRARPPPHELKVLVESAGGAWLGAADAAGAGAVVVTCSEDRALWPALRARGARLVTNEFVLSGALRQRADMMQHAAPR